ncbi:hypothetical protein ACROYT_G025775 [Oculina patagonica]
MQNIFLSASFPSAQNYSSPISETISETQKLSQISETPHRKLKENVFYFDRSSFKRLQKITGMEKRHRKILIKCHEALVEDLEPTDVFRHLIQNEVLTFHLQERIRNIDPTPRGRSEQLLSILPNRGPRAYEVFVKALEKTQPFLACLLLREELSAAEAKCKELESQLEKGKTHNNVRNKHPAY